MIIQKPYYDTGDFIEEENQIVWACTECPYVSTEEVKECPKCRNRESSTN